MKCKRLVLIVGCFVYLISCKPQNKYLTDALNIIEARSFKNDQIDWHDFRSKVLKHAKNDKTIDDFHNSIKYALSLLQDGHSFFISSEDYKKGLSNNPSEKINSIESNFENQIGYIKIPGFDVSEALCKAFSVRLQETIIDIDKNNLNGWIIDLRDNIGGDMWPILLGIGPIVGNGTAGYFVTNKKVFIKWGYSEGKTYDGESIVSSLTNNYELKNTNKKIAVLISRRTASSGEIIALAFKGLPKTRFFGDRTAGRTTSNSSILLSDSSMIQLMTTVLADRNKTIYGESIVPDEITKNEDPIKVATKWINNNWTMLN
jgi:carboxyl-terminal processing protease